MTAEDLFLVDERVLGSFSSVDISQFALQRRD